MTDTVYYRPKEISRSQGNPSSYEYVDPKTGEASGSFTPTDLQRWTEVGGRKYNPNVQYVQYDESQNPNVIQQVAHREESQYKRDRATADYLQKIPEKERQAEREAIMAMKPADQKQFLKEETEYLAEMDRARENSQPPLEKPVASQEKTAGAKAVALAYASQAVQWSQKAGALLKQRYQEQFKTAQSPPLRGEVSYLGGRLKVSGEVSPLLNSTNPQSASQVSSSTETVKYYTGNPLFLSTKEISAEEYNQRQYNALMPSGERYIYDEFRIQAHFPYAPNEWSAEFARLQKKGTNEMYQKSSLSLDWIMPKEGIHFQTQENLMGGGIVLPPVPNLIEDKGKLLDEVRLGGLIGAGSALKIAKQFTDYPVETTKNVALTLLGIKLLGAAITGTYLGYKYIKEDIIPNAATIAMNPTVEIWGRAIEIGITSAIVGGLYKGVSEPLLGKPFISYNFEVVPNEAGKPPYQIDVLIKQKSIGAIPYTPEPPSPLVERAWQWESTGGSIRVRGMTMVVPEAPPPYINTWGEAGSLVKYSYKNAFGEEQSLSEYAYKSTKIAENLYQISYVKDKFPAGVGGSTAIALPQGGIQWQLAPKELKGQPWDQELKLPYEAEEPSVPRSNIINEIVAGRQLTLRKSPNYESLYKAKAELDKLYKNPEMNSESWLGQSYPRNVKSYDVQSEFVQIQAGPQVKTFVIDRFGNKILSSVEGEGKIKVPRSPLVAPPDPFLMQLTDSKMQWRLGKKGQIAFPSWGDNTQPLPSDAGASPMQRARFGEGRFKSKIESPFGSEAKATPLYGNKASGKVGSIVTPLVLSTSISGASGAAVINAPESQFLSTSGALNESLAESLIKANIEAKFEGRTGATSIGGTIGGSEAGSTSQSDIGIDIPIDIISDTTPTPDITVPYIPVIEIPEIERPPKEPKEEGFPPFSLPHNIRKTERWGIPTFDVFMKKRKLKLRKGKYISLGFEQLNKKGLSKGAALRLGATLTDLTTSRTFKIVPTGKKEETANESAPSILDRFTQKGNIYIEKVKYSISSKLEKMDIPYKAHRLRKLHKDFGGWRL